MKKVIGFIFTICVFIFCFGSNNVNASNASTDLDMKLSRVIELGDTKYIDIKVTNSSEEVYSFGWVSSCNLVVTTSKGTYTKGISSGSIYAGTKTYSYTIDAPGTIESIVYTNILVLGDNGLPSLTDSADITVDVSSYRNVDAILVIVIALAILVVAVALIVVIAKRKGNRVYIITGKIILACGILLMIYGGICFILKPTLGQADFYNVAHTYWILLLIGMIITAIGFVVKNKGGKSSKNVVVTISDKHNDSNNPFSEQNKFFGEEITKDHDKYNDF